MFCAFGQMLKTCLMRACVLTLLRCLYSWIRCRVTRLFLSRWRTKRTFYSICQKMLSKLSLHQSGKELKLGQADGLTDFYCRVNCSSVTYVYLTGFTCVNKIQEIVWRAWVKRKSWTALNFCFKRKPFRRSFVFYLSKASEIHVRNRRKIYSTVEIHLWCSV